MDRTSFLRSKNALDFRTHFCLIFDPVLDAKTEPVAPLWRPKWLPNPKKLKMKISEKPLCFIAFLLQGRSPDTQKCSARATPDDTFSKLIFGRLLVPLLAPFWLPKLTPKRWGKITFLGPESDRPFLVFWGYPLAPFWPPQVPF